jgi:hypothetical protein
MKNLTPDRLRGSLLRCLLLTGHPPHQTANLLTNLVRISDVVISSSDHWMPQGLRNYKETTLIDTSYFLGTEKRKVLKDWWLKKPRGARLPTWDIASTCTVEGTKGLLLVEAKAHDRELSEAGKSQPTTSNSRMNHDHIGLAIRQANSGLNEILRGWALSRDSHYQLSNRFAWAWKLAMLGVPVILVYLGFLNATEMLDQGQPFDNHEVWQTCVRNHSKNIVPEDAWEKRLEIAGTPVWFLIRSMQLELEV